MIRDIYPSGFNSFIIPFMIGMIFVLCWCFIGAARIIIELSAEDRKKFFLSFLNPKIMAKNVRDWFCDCLFHVKLWKRNKLLGYMHSSIAFGWFMLIVIGHVEVFLYTPERIHRLWYPIFFRYFVAVSDSTMKGSFFFFLMDFFLLVVLSGIALAIIKRVASRLFGMRRTTRASLTDLIGLYSLWSIFPLRLLAEGFTADISGGSFLTKSLNLLLSAFFSDSMNALPVWWAYSIALGVFLCVLPFSRYVHIPAEILLIPMRNAGLPIRRARRGLARAEIYSCPGCGVCIDACPMSAAAAHVKDTTVYLNRQLKRNNKKRIDQISDKCLLCGKCGSVCPVGVEGDKLRIAYRSRRKYNLTPDYSAIDEGRYVDTAGSRVLYFAGCMTSLTPSIKKSILTVLKAVGEDFKIMDEDGGICCGRPMLMAGRKDAAEQMIRKNTNIIKASGASVLLVSCPICYRIFKENYDLEGIEVLHHTEYLDRIISDGRITMSHTGRKYVYHDPCELGRGTDIYVEPRRVLSLLGTLVKAGKEGKESICCGGSVGSISLGFDKRKALTENALANLTVASPDVIVTACPLCKSTLSRYASSPVKDIAEVIADTTVIQ
ncbi:MAG: 4Fe-4S dicluster domain-containing protein [Bacteroidales bacterium]|nr:4Fe-4S dicluster domain-containing protein [Bacteroidales bacterium]